MWGIFLRARPFARYNRKLNGAGKRVEELSVRASQEKDEDEEEEKLDLVQMTCEMHICLHEESNKIMKWTEANKGREYNIEKKRY